MRSLTFFVLTIALVGAVTSVLAQPGAGMTPIQREIERQRQRLSSSDAEDRRDALMHLGNLHRPDASRAAAAGLSDADPGVRVAAAHAVVSLPAADAVSLLLPLLQDKSEFVRRETAYSLGATRSRSATAQLLNLLQTDKEIGVRAAAAFALGEIGDEAAAPALAEVLSGPSGEKKKSRTKPDPFVMRAAAHSLGQIHSASAVSVLVAALDNDRLASDVRREAAIALGMIGDSVAVPALRAAYASDDPYLSEAARNALRRMHVAIKN